MADCTSQYKLDEDNLFKKVTKDCGHSEKLNPECRLAEIKDKMSDRVILPEVDPIDITGKFIRVEEDITFPLTMQPAH